MLLAIDPSVRSPGVALFNGTNELIACTRLIIQAMPAGSEGEHWLAVSDEILAWVRRSYHYHQISNVVFEKPQIYRASRSKGNPNDLLGLVGVSMAVAARLPQAFISSPTPAEWCGNLKKNTRGSAKASPRAKRILSRLTPAEAKLVPDQHDALDAVGLGLWFLGRLNPVRVFSNGRDV